VARVERLAGGATAPAPRAPELVAAPRPLPAPARAASVPAPAAPVPVVAPPAAAPAPPAPVAVTLADGADAVLQAMVAQAQTRPSLATPLRAARAREEGDVLVLEFAPDFFRLADEHADEYRELARKASGRPLKVKIVSAAATPASAPAAGAETETSSPERKRQRLLEEAAREPAVQEALDLFGGRVVDVRETKG